MSQPGKPESVSRPGKHGEEGAADDRTERNLDEALEETFPASDPIAVEPDKEDGADQAGKARDGKAGGAG